MSGRSDGHTTPESLTGPDYRPDIDGLRAVAVVSVVLFHAFPWMIPGGFIGVDVFFVISGYLITRIILRGTTTGTFDFRDFYAHRARRIFPSLIVVLASVYVIGWLTLLQVEFAQLGKHIAAGALFVANFALWREAGYFDVDSSAKPLTHLWSLGIEEQFYIVWPFAIWLLAKSKTLVKGAAVLVGAVSFVACIAQTNSSSAGLYYSPLTRFWELMIGSLLAMVGGELLARIGRRTIVPSIGVAMIVIALATIDASSPFPSWNALLPTIGTALIISGGASNPVARLLSNKVLVWVGLISYPLYLWHWPLLVIARIVAGTTPTPQVRTAIVVLSFVLAAVTYRLIETPLKIRLNTRTKMAVLVVPLVVVATVGVVTHQNDGLPSRRVVTMNPPLDDGEPDGIDDVVENGCGLDPEAESLMAHCLRDSREKPRFALIGDSKAYTLIGGVIRTSRPGGRWLMIGGTNENGAPVPMIIDHPAYEWYQPSITAAIDAVNRNDYIETVVLVGAVRAMYQIASESSFAELPTSPNGDLVRVGLAATVARLVANGKKVVLYVDNPPLTRPEDCMKRRTRLPLVENLLQTNVDNCEITRSTFDTQTSHYRAMLDEIASGYTEAVTVFDPNDVYFDNFGIARHVVNGQMMYSFTDHPSDAAAEVIGAELNTLVSGLR